jgi:alpha-L-rhamnosidase
MKIFRFFTLCIAISALLVSCKEGQKSIDVLHPKNLACENLINPMGIDSKSPRLSWNSESEQRSQVQTNYRVLVSSSLSNLQNDNGDLWDSKKVESDQSLYIPYAGIALKSGMRCYWKVKVWDKRGKESQWSEVSQWSMGLLDSADWKAKWIGLDQITSHDNINTKFTRLSARMLRKEFTLTKKIKTATAYISGLGLYELYVNGKKIGNQVLAPACTEYNKRVLYNTFDVTSNFKEGKNAIGTILGNGRFVTMRYPEITHFGFPKMLLQVNITFTNGQDTILTSDESWKIFAYGPIIANNEYDGEEYDARRETPGWNEPGFNDENWRKAEIVKSPSRRIEAQMNQFMKIKQTIKPVSVKEVTPGTYIYDMGQNMVGWAKLAVKAEKGTKIALRFAETLQKDGNLYLANIRTAKVTDVYTCKGEGTETWEPRFTYHGFRYIEMKGFPGKPKLDAIEGKVVYDDIDSIGSFVTSNEVINQIYKNAYWGIRGNYRSMPTDCPQRDERMGWLGDRATGSKGESYIFRNNALYAKWLADIEDAQTDSGSIPDVAPSYWKIYNDGVTWPAAYLIIANMIYEQCGDIAPIQKRYASMKKWVLYMKEKYMENDLMPRDTYGDWCMPPESPKLIHSMDPRRITPGNYLGTSYYYYMLKLMEHFAILTHNEKDQETFSALAEKVKKAFNDNFYDGLNKTYTNNTATANIIALAYDLAPENLRPTIFNNLLEKTLGENNGHISTGLIGIQWLMRTLTQYGRADIAYKLATNTDYPSWGYMAKEGATTIWELWNGNTAAPDMNSGNHVMLLGDLIIWYYENLAGIKSDPEKPGFKHIIMKPEPVEGLGFVNASYNSPYGIIRSEWKTKTDTFTWDITVPVNTTATIYVPASGKNSVTLGKVRASIAKGIDFQGMEGDRAVYKIGSGKYTFVSSSFKITKHAPVLPSPVITPGDSSFAKPAKAKVKISIPFEGAEIHYTTDGTNPTKSSPIYKTPVSVAKSTVIKAKAFKSGFEPSYLQSSSFDVFDPSTNGLNYSYYEGKWTKLPDFNMLSPRKTGKTSSFDLNKIKLREDYFGVVFSGFIKIEKAGTYSFYLSSDDGSRLQVDKKLIINNDGIHGITEKSGNTRLSEGLHEIRIEMFDATYGEKVALSYGMSGTIPRQQIPFSILFFNK